MFPPSLFEYLTKVGWISIRSDELYGLGRGLSRGYNLIENTEWERHESGNPIPAHLIPLLNDGFGNLYCINIRTEKIVFWDHEKPPGHQRGTVVAESLHRFLTELAD